MTSTALTYGVITPVWNEEQRLLTCYESLRRQHLPPATWTIVDSGSTDATTEIARRLVERHDWINLLTPRSFMAPGRGGPIARSYLAGIDAIATPPDLVVFVDADVSFEPDYFGRLVSAFVDDAALGMASGRQFEHVRGAWREQRMTGTMVAAPLRAYRWQCLQDVLPLDEDLGWDGLDHVRATARGWRTAVLPDLSFRHHRREGLREGRWHYWAGEGRAAYRMGYRLSYLLARAFYRVSSEPAAVMLLYGYVAAAMRRDTPIVDAETRVRVRDAQRLRELPSRISEALGPSKGAVLQRSRRPRPLNAYGHKARRTRRRSS